jgi:hypothetical protein
MSSEMLQGKKVQRCGHCLIASSGYDSANAPSGNRSIGFGSQRQNIMKAAFIEQYGGPEVLKYGAPS